MLEHLTVCTLYFCSFMPTSACMHYIVYFNTFISVKFWYIPVINFVQIVPSIRRLTTEQRVFVIAKDTKILQANTRFIR